jgi:hypothetical protein
MIEDIPTVKELIERMVKEAEGVLSEVKHKVFP